MNKREQRILAFITDFIHEHDYPPSVRDIGKACNVPSTSNVQYWLDALERDGYIARDRAISRSIRILPREVAS